MSSINFTQKTIYKTRKRFAWAPAVLSTALARDSTNSSTRTWGHKMQKRKRDCSATKGNFYDLFSILF